MRCILVLAVSSAFTLWIAPAHGAPKLKTDSSSREAEEILASIDNSCSEIADTAYRLNDQAFRLRDPEGHLDGLATLRGEINRVGRELQVLDAQRDSLAEWEGRALNEIYPLLHDAAVNADRAIDVYNSDRTHLFASTYMDDTAKISQDTSRAAALLHNYLRLAKTREKESRLEESLGELQ